MPKQLRPALDRREQKILKWFLPEAAYKKHVEEGLESFSPAFIDKLNAFSRCLMDAENHTYLEQSTRAALDQAQLPPAADALSRFNMLAKKSFAQTRLIEPFKVAYIELAAAIVEKWPDIEDKQLPARLPLETLRKNTAYSENFSILLDSANTRINDTNRTFSV